MIDLLMIEMPPSGPRDGEYLKAITTNLMCSHVGRVLLSTSEGDNKSLATVASSKKAEVWTHGKRLTFAAAFDELSARLGAGKTAALVNADCWFDDTVAKLFTVDMTNVLIALSRDAKPWVYSADAWLFKTPMKLTNIDVELGRSGCDLRVCARAQDAGYTVLNPARDVLLHHEHKDHPGYGNGTGPIPTPPPWAFSTLLAIR